MGSFFARSDRETGLHIGGEDDGKAAQAQVAGEPQAQGDQAAAQQAQVTGGGGDDADKARASYEAALKERDARIAEAAKTVESAERLRAEMDELKRAGDEQRVSFELQIAGARNVKAARTLLADYDNDIDKLKTGEPWLFGTGTSAPEQAGTTGLPNAGAATDEGAQIRRCRRIAGIEDKEETSYMKSRPKE